MCCLLKGLLSSASTERRHTIKPLIDGEFNETARRAIRLNDSCRSVVKLCRPQNLGDVDEDRRVSSGVVQNDEVVHFFFGFFFTCFGSRLGVPASNSLASSGLFFSRKAR